MCVCVCVYNRVLVSYLSVVTDPSDSALAAALSHNHSSRYNNIINE